MDRVLFKKLIVVQLDKNFPTFYGIRRLITVFTSSHHFNRLLDQLNPVHTLMSFSFNIIASFRLRSLQ